jgi:hypothetical protein
MLEIANSLSVNWVQGLFWRQTLQLWEIGRMRAFCSFKSWIPTFANNDADIER